MMSSPVDLFECTARRGCIIRRGSYKYNVAEKGSIRVWAACNLSPFMDEVLLTRAVTRCRLYPSYLFLRDRLPSAESWVSGNCSDSNRRLTHFSAEVKRLEPKMRWLWIPREAWCTSLAHAVTHCFVIVCLCVDWRFDCFGEFSYNNTISFIVNSSRVKYRLRSRDVTTL